MKTIAVNREQAKVELTSIDLLIVNNALNEVCNALDTTEFSTRMGASLNEAQTLLREVADLLNCMDR